MTYGWALILIAAVIGVLVFAFSTPPEIFFTSSQPNKIMVKGGSISPEGDVEVKLQNITGGEIRVVYATLDQGFEECPPEEGGATLNQDKIIELAEENAVIVPPGGSLDFACIIYKGGGQGTITIGYKGQFNLEREIVVNVKGRVRDDVPPAPTCGPGDPDCCGNEVCDAGEDCGNCFWDCGGCEVVLNLTPLKCSELCPLATGKPRCISVGTDPEGTDGTYANPSVGIELNEATEKSCQDYCQQLGYDSCASVGTDDEGISGFVYTNDGGPCTVAGSNCNIEMNSTAPAILCPAEGGHFPEWTNCKCASCEAMAGAECETVMGGGSTNCIINGETHPGKWTNCRCSQ